MKRLVSILLLAITVATGFAQSSTPDYIQKAKVGLTQYYPQFKDYFEPIFTRTFKLSTSSQNIINTKIHENFDLFDEELPTEKDKVTTILLVLENVISGQDQLSKSINNTTRGKDLIAIAEEISNDINQQARDDRNQAKAEIDQAKAEIEQIEQAKAEIEQAKAEIEQAKAEIEQTKQRTNLIKRRTNKLNEIINYINSNEIKKETIGKIVDKMEEYFTLFEIKEIKEDQWLQKMIMHYINYTRQINRVPSKLGENFIDEYNRITKNM